MDLEKREKKFSIFKKKKKILCFEYTIGYNAYDKKNDLITVTKAKSNLNQNNLFNDMLWNFNLN